MNEPSEFRLDSTYRNTNNWKNPDDVFNRFFRFDDGKGINNAAGFRPKSKRVGGSTDIVNCAFCILVTNFGETEWPDFLDRESGIFTYYGDNRSPGKLEETAVGGNRLLRQVFELVHQHRRAEVAPFLCFEKFKDETGTQMRFLGLACPGGQGLSHLDDLVAVWRVTGIERFQNYRAMFTILREDSVVKDWLEDMVGGTPAVESKYCPPAWKRWVESGMYTPLQCDRQLEPRTKKEQLPTDERQRLILMAIYEQLSDREFEFASADLVRLMDERFTATAVSRAVRDGGCDVVCSYRVGHATHQVTLSAYVEAKRWNPQSSVGVKPMMRLISRLKHRDIGVFVTTSFFDQQVQRELIEDHHPVILVAGGDIARLLISKDIGDTEQVRRWIESVRARTADGGGTT